jgi:hypothetical protein
VTTARFSFTANNFVPSGGELFVFLPPGFAVRTDSNSASYTLSGGPGVSGFGYIGTSGNNKVEDASDVAGITHAVAIRILLPSGIPANSNISLAITGIVNKVGGADVMTASNEIFTKWWYFR